MNNPVHSSVVFLYSAACNRITPTMTKWLLDDQETAIFEKVGKHKWRYILSS